MKPYTLEQLAGLNVKCFAQSSPAEWSVEFFPPVGQPNVAQMPEAAPPPCKCGHAEFEHNEADECLMGCDAMKCQERG